MDFSDVFGVFLGVFRIGFALVMSRGVGVQPVGVFESQEFEWIGVSVPDLVL